MIKFSGIFDLKPGVDREEAWQYWREKHVLYAKEYLLPGARKYNIDRVVHSFEKVDVWGISEFWFDDMETAMTALGRLQKAPPDDFYIKRIQPAKRVLLQDVGIDPSGRPGNILEADPATMSGKNMFKAVSIFSLRPKADPEQAYRIWREKQTSAIRNKPLPGAKWYTINKVVHSFGEVDVYGYSMIWFDNKDAALKGAERLRKAPADEFLTKYVKAPKLVIVEEEKVEL